MVKKPKLLKVTDRLLTSICKSHLLESILGDLEETYAANLTSVGAFRAGFSYFIQSIGFLKPVFLKKSSHSNTKAMFRNYFIATVRNLQRHKFYALINLIGLSIGMTAGFFILQYAYRQLTYDRFLENRENIYRVQTNRYNNGELTTQWASGCAGVGLHMKEDFPEVVDFVNLRKSFAQISYEENYFSVSHPYYAGNNFFEVFSIPLVQGVDSLVLKEPMTVVLSESLAKKIFGDESPVGKIIQQNDVANFKVTGVFQDLPERSHFKFDLLYSFDSYVAFAGQEVRTSWQWDGFLNYVVLHPDVDPEELAEKFPEWITSREGEELAQYNAGMEFVLQPLSKIHLISNYRGEIKPTGNQTITYFLLIIGMFVLFIAWINYINLTTARAISRAKEVGIRKVMGSYRAQLIGQFMFESFFLNFVAFAVSAILVVMIFPIFNRFVGNSVVYTWPDTPVFWFGLIGLFIVGFILSGFYPAFVLSNFKPITVLKGKFASSTNGNNLRKGLVTFQFLASVILITGTYVVFKQMTHLRSQDLGVNIDQNVIVKTPVYASDSIMAIKDAVFRNKIAANSAVNKFTASSSIPGRNAGWNAGGIRLLSQTEAESNQYRIIGSDDDFVEFYGLEIIEGRNFDRSYGNERNNVLFNEAAIALIGFDELSEAINEKIFFWGDTFNIVGVVKNYRQESPKEAYDPMIFRYFPSTSGFYSLNISQGNLQEAISSIQQDWDQAFGSKTFDFFFLDDYYNEQYESEVKFGSIFGLFSGLAVLVACMGLFSLASFVTSLRSKEVGVRKVLGASVNQLLLLLTRDFIKLIGISILISVPISWWLMKTWLQNFETRIALGVELFLVPALLIIVVAICTVLHRTYKTTMVNPAETLHDE